MKHVSDSEVKLRNTFMELSQNVLRQHKIYVHSPVFGKIYFYEIKDGNINATMVHVQDVMGLLSDKALEIVIWHPELFN
jgi:hypothetical protein